MKPRVVVVDLLRLLALIEMINGHTLDAVLDDRLRLSDAYATFSWFRGLVSVSFMLASGLAFHLTTVSKFERHRADPAAARHRMRRALEIVALGYVLRFPFEVFTGDPVLIRQGIARVLEVDVLHTIGMSLFVLEVLVLTLRRKWQVVTVAAVLALLAVTLAPLGEALSATHVWPALTNYVGHAGGSLFPPVPWSAYLFSGVVAGAFAFPDGATTRARVYVPRLLAVSVAALLASLAIHHSPWTLWHSGLSHASSPTFVVLKLGVVLAAIAVLALAFARVKALPMPLRILAGETLSMYGFHLIVLYWTGLSLHAQFGHTLSFGPALTIAGSLIVVSVLFGLGWNRQKVIRAQRRAERDRPVPTEDPRGDVSSSAAADV